VISIELIEGCNFKCYFCRAREVKENVYVDLALFKRIILEAEQLGITTVKLTPCRGEPFLHPHIYEILEFACAHMTRVHMFTNATAINVKKLKRIDRTGLELDVSFYGDTSETFIRLTETSSHLFDIFHRKLADLTANGIEYTIHRRDQEYFFDYEGGPDKETLPFDANAKCKYHQNPKIMANGDVTFCTLARDEMPDVSEIFFANMHNTSLREALEHPMRYKFFDSQSICENYCTSYDRPCRSKHSIVSLKLLAAAKQKYVANSESIDAAYTNLEQAVKASRENQD
jgi:hypothetical protein